MAQASCGKPERSGPLWAREPGSLQSPCCVPFSASADPWEAILASSRGDTCVVPQDLLDRLRATYDAQAAEIERLRASLGGPVAEVVNRLQELEAEVAETEARNVLLENETALLQQEEQELLREVEQLEKLKESKSRSAEEARLQVEELERFLPPSARERDHEPGGGAAPGGAPAPGWRRRQGGRPPGV
ncbi:unnamed protein product [Prorocentrum cordatum]|uniref:Uncharacterized protein n=1 Tax=Prorocentrum cordatum TaxID=2364126 RepID=A0ABN9TNS8_9DINO|nr:unnamed protein product [Polarella glacialis]